MPEDNAAQDAQPNALEDVRKFQVQLVLHMGKEVQALSELLKPLGYDFQYDALFCGIVKTGSFGRREPVQAAPIGDWLPPRETLRTKQAAHKFMQTFSQRVGRLEKLLEVVGLTQEVFPYTRPPSANN